MSGAATGGLLAARSGWKSAGRNAVIGGAILAAIEGMGVLISRYVMPMFERSQQEGMFKYFALTVLLSLLSYGLSCS